MTHQKLIAKQAAVGYTTIIFICPQDVFKQGLHKYTFENTCMERPGFKLNDESYKIFLCAGGTADDVSEDMKDFLDWIATGERNSSKLVNKLEDAVDKARKKDEWRLEFMTLAMKYKEKYNEGLETGLEQGIEKGLEKGRLAEIYHSVQDGDYSAERGAEKTGMSMAEFAEAMRKEGYSLPAGYR